MENCKEVVLFWIGHGVKIFRVDNPHTKPVAFWEWLIGEVQDASSGRDLPGRSVHAAQDDEGARESGLYPVVYLLHLAQYESRID